MADLTPIKHQLATYIFQTLRSRLVTGLAVGLLPSAPKQELPGQEILIFVEPVADCELAALRCDILGYARGLANDPDVPVRFLPTGRFEGLAAASGDSISFNAPRQFNLPASS